MSDTCLIRLNTTLDECYVSTVNCALGANTKVELPISFSQLDILEAGLLSLKLRGGTNAKVELPISFSQLNILEAALSLMLRGGGGGLLPLWGDPLVRGLGWFVNFR